MILIHLWLLAVPGLSHGADTPFHLKKEAHNIFKRFADVHEFEGHDIADVLFKKHPDTLHHINRRDLSSVINSQHERDFTSLMLSMKNSKDSLRLKLKKRAIVDDKTEFVTHTKQGRAKRSPSVFGDCFATGHADESPNEVAAVSMCDGLHGVVSRRGVDYYIHPVEREAADEGHQVHVLWKRSVGDANFDGDFGEANHADDAAYVKDEDMTSRDLNPETQAALSDAWKTATNMTIEMALFTDAAALKKVKAIAPGREDEYMLVTMAAANALYGDREKVGYDVFFKIKLIEQWQDDPEEYDFKQSILDNMKSCCRYTREKYKKPMKYDMHFLHTGVAGGLILGRAFAGGVCTSKRCASTRSVAPNRYRIVAHEIGHNLGILHRTKLCPPEILNVPHPKGFLGRGNNFAPCYKWFLDEFIKRGKGVCMFNENVVDPISFHADLPRVLLGQSMSPDKLCELFSGNGFKYFRTVDQVGKDVCQAFWCVNANTTSYGHEAVMEKSVPHGLPCGDELFCRRHDCRQMDNSMGWDVEYLRTLKSQHEWSSWSGEWSECSSNCGTGVQIKERTCLIGEGPNVSPFCKGSENVKARLCSQDPCDGEPNTVKELRKVRGDKMCAKFHKHGVQLLGNAKYLPVSAQGVKRKFYFSQSCLLSCERQSSTKRIVDGLLPGGTPCLETTRGSYDRQRFDIEMRCVKGKCLEFSDCRDNELKDECGVCTNIDGYDGSRCVRETVNINDPGLTSGDVAFITTIPTGSSRISVEAKHWSNGRLEIWTEDESKIIWGHGKTGQLSRSNYQEGNEAEYAGAKWTLHHKQYVRCEELITESVVLKWRVGSSSSKQVVVSYLLP